MLSFWIAVKRQNRKDSKIINIMIVDLDVASTHSPDNSHMNAWLKRNLELSVGISLVLHYNLTTGKFILYFHFKSLEDTKVKVLYSSLAT